MNEKLTRQLRWMAQDPSRFDPDLIIEAAYTIDVLAADYVHEPIDKGLPEEGDMANG
jgi:hypothetical protein